VLPTRAATFHLLRVARYEAYIEKDWEKLGLAHLLVFRTREPGTVDFALLLVDLLCLGVKDAHFEAGVAESDLRTFIEERLPEGHREGFDPACAKKLIDGALAYAESLGFAPHRDFRKARKVLSGIDASACPREFTYGRDGRPCYVRGVDDDTRVDRICAILTARCGADGFDYVDPSVVDVDDRAVREDLMDWLEHGPDEAPHFHEISGLITAMLICPTVLSPLKIMEVWADPKERVWESEEDAKVFLGLLMSYWNQLDDLVRDTLAPNAHPDDSMIDVWEEDLPDPATHREEMLWAFSEWARGFHRATERWPEAWGDALTRPDLAPYWEVVSWWAGLDQRENQDRLLAAAQGEKPITFDQAVTALARALRPVFPPRMRR
jgi:yecA family protein